MFHKGYWKTLINMNMNYIKKTKIQTKTIMSSKSIRKTEWLEGKSSTRRPQDTYKDEAHEVAYAESPY